MNVLVILQGPAYGDERSYNALCLASNLAKRDGVDVKVFCFGDSDATRCTEAADGPQGQLRWRVHEVLDALVAG